MKVIKTSAGNSASPCPTQRLFSGQSSKDANWSDCKFRRQFSVGSYVIDFYSAEVKLGIELDGDSHFELGAREYDEKRRRFIEAFGIQIVRFLNTEIYDNLYGVLEKIGNDVAHETTGEPRTCNWYRREHMTNQDRIIAHHRTANL